MARKEITAHTTDGDMPCTIVGDITTAEAALRANILAKYPAATFTVTYEE